MPKESVSPVNERPILREFSCPTCGGHHLGAKVECNAQITRFDDKTTYFILDDQQEHDIALFFCKECEWNTDEESSVRAYVK